jgi:hypothetical protein
VTDKTLEFIMQTITTKFSNNGSPRVTATSTNGGRSFVSYPHELSGATAHWQAANKLAQKLGWTGTMQAGSMKDGYIFVFLDSSDQFTIGA